MNHLTLSPALGWPVGGAVAVVLLACAIAQIVLHVRRRADSVGHGIDAQYRGADQ